MVDYRRVGISILMGALLGVFCIVGVGQRLFAGDYIGNWLYLIGMWYNRVIMGMLIGFAGEMVLIKSANERNLRNAVIRGLVFGVLVSLAIFLSTEFRDIPSLFAGFAYGVIIDLVATWTEK